MMSVSSGIKKKKKMRKYTAVVSVGLGFTAQQYHCRNDVLKVSLFTYLC